MRILVTNDDGIRAPGIEILANWARKLGEVTIIAPKTEQSAKSHSINIHTPFEARKVDWIDGIECYSVDSAPADCVRFAFSGLGREFDLVLSGINKGLNLGEDIAYSGTLAAVFEAAYYKCRAIAFSTVPETFSWAEKYLDTIVENMAQSDPVSSNETRSTLVDGNLVYFKFINVEYSSFQGEQEAEFDQYFLLVYIDTSSYYSFTTAINVAIFRAIIIAVLASTVLSLILAFPLFFSTRKLSKFASRVGKGDFTPVRGHIMSAELSNLGMNMNRMAQKLEQSDKEQKTFFQNASHELRTPLMSIQGYAEGIKYDVFNDDEKNDAVDVIISETTRLTGLVENLLSISKMDMSRSGTYTVKKTIINVQDLAEDIVDRVRGNFLHDGKELVTDIRAGDSYICANENDILRMLENIFSNCNRYADKQVEFSVRKVKNEIEFTIADDGPGIDEDFLPNLFDRFAKGSDGKHGIGLALVKAIAEEHDGTVTAGNRPQGGAVFTVSLPVIRPKEQLSHKNNKG